MNQKCIILGAGFSKAIADLPVTNGMFNSFKKVLEEQQLLGHENRVNWGMRIFDFIEYLQRLYLEEPYSRAEKDGKIIKSNYYENFEAICSIIDINLLSEVHALCESKGLTSDLSNKPLFINKTTSELKQIRGWIGTYLKLALINNDINENLISKFFNKHFSNLSSIITFNYDLIIERFLFKQDLWFPKDGYGFNIKNIPQISSIYNDKKSSIPILKMHGSLNWKVDKYNNNDFALEWFDDSNNYFFPGYLTDEKERPFIYQGAFSTNSWLFPSWIKQFSFPEIIKVWQIAAQKLRDSSEIIFIGYSLPKADTPVYSLFTSIDFSKKKIILIDPNANELIENYLLIIPQENITIIPKCLEEYLTYG